MCYRCGVLGHDNRHCTVLGSEQAVENQYDDWIRANDSSKGGQERMNSRQEMNQPPNGLERMAAQPSMEGTVVTSSGGRNEQDDKVKDAEKQVGQSNACDKGQSGSQEACYSGEWDNTKVSPLSVEMSENTCDVRKILNFESNECVGDAPACG